MPSNSIQINGSPDLVFDVPDSKMPGIVRKLMDVDTSGTNPAKEALLSLDEDTRTPERKAADDAIRERVLAERKWKNFNLYQDFTRTTAVYPGAGTGSFEAIVYCALKGAGEAGEFCEKLGKLMRKQGSIDALNRDNMSEEFRLAVAQELGDVVWYMARLANELGFMFSEVMEMNVKKLTSRKERGVLKGSGDNR